MDNLEQYDKTHLLWRKLKEWTNNNSEKLRPCLQNSLYPDEGVLIEPLKISLSNLSNEDPDFMWFSIAMYQIKIMASIDPLQIHFQICREVLNENCVSDTKAIDSLARELTSCCCKFSEFLECKYIEKEFNKSFNNMNIIEILVCVETSEEHGRFKYEKENRNILEWYLSEFIKTLGKVGNSISEDINKQSTDLYKEYSDCGFSKEKRSEFWCNWIKFQDGKPSLLSPYLTLLARILWKQASDPYTPAIARGALEKSIRPLVSKTSKVTHRPGEIVVEEESGRVLATANIPCMDQARLNRILKGAGAMSSLSGHRLLRWQIKSGCQNIKNDKKDPRSIIVNGGYEGIANLIGCGNDSHKRDEIKSILYAQANMEFTAPNGDTASSLIILHELKKHANGEPSKIRIILGDWLMPSYLFSLPKNEQRLLIPIVDLPKFIGSPNTYSAQAMLQLLILEELSQQSIEYSEKGKVFIAKETWESLCNESKLPLKMLPDVLKAWAQPNEQGKSFLNQDSEYFALSNDQKDAETLLIEQGKIRLEGSLAGQKSAQKKREKIRRISKRK